MSHHTTPQSSVGQGLRYNSNKTRFDLLEPFAIQKLAEVFTKGAQKYAEHNWLQGMPWSSMIASLKRHLSAFEQCEDIDPETGCMHMAHVAWNALALVSYSKYFPQGDNRLPIILPKPKIALDIDEVICGWVDGWIEKYGMDKPSSWYFDPKLVERFEQMKKDDELKDFMLGLKPLVDPSTIPFEPHCYITARSIPSEWTEEWLVKHGFPVRKVITVGLGQSKLTAVKESGADIFVDDNYSTFEELNRNGICCYLMDAFHNQRYNVGSKRIKSLQDLPF